MPSQSKKTKKILVSNGLKIWAEKTNYEIRRKRVYTDQTIDNSGLTLYHEIGKSNVKVNIYNSLNQQIDLDIVKNLDHIVLKSNTLISDIKVVISG
jgi:hypothetical protein